VRHFLGLQEKLAEAEARVAELSQQLQQLQVEKVGLSSHWKPLTAMFLASASLQCAMLVS
jgi:hypothetical protein